MSELPRRLSPGTTLSANWINRLLDYLRSRDLRAGPGIKLTRTPSGTTISAAPGADAGPDEPDAFVLRITSGSAGVYTGEKPGDGLFSRKRYKLVTPEVHTRGTVATPATVIAHRVACRLENVFTRGGSS